MNTHLVEVTVQKENPSQLRISNLLLAILFVLSVIAHASLWKLSQQNKEKLSCLCVGDQKTTRNIQEKNEVEVENGLQNETVTNTNIKKTTSNDLVVDSSVNQTVIKERKKPSSFFLFLEDLQQLKNYIAKWNSLILNKDSNGLQYLKNSMKKYKKIPSGLPDDTGDSINGVPGKIPLLEPPTDDQKEFVTIRMFGMKDRKHSPCALETHHQIIDDLTYKEIVCSKNQRNSFAKLHCVQLQRDIVLPYVKADTNGQKSLTHKRIRVGSGCELRFIEKAWNKNVFS